MRVDGSWLKRGGTLTTGKVRGSNFERKISGELKVEFEEGTSRWNSSWDYR